MSYSINPKRVEDEMLERLNYGETGQIDDFTLSKWRYKLEDMIKNSNYSEETIVALGLVLFNMGDYKGFLEHYERGGRLYPNSLLLFKHRILGILNMVNNKAYDIPDFDLYDAWFDPKININMEPFVFAYGSKKLVYAGNNISLKKDNIAKISLSSNQILTFEFGPITFKRNYYDVKDEGMEFDEEFTWEIVERLRTCKLNPEEVNYLRHILADNYDAFIKLVDPNYSLFLDGEDVNMDGDTYSSVEKFIESLVI